MNLSIALFLAAVLIPLLFGSPRTAPFWLGVQGVALAANVLGHHELLSLHAGASLLDLVVLRGVVAPLILKAANDRATRLTEHLLPSNLLVWALAIAVAVFGFQFAISAAVTESALGLGTVAACVTLPLLLLATNESLPAQLVALLMLENAASLLETFHVEPWEPVIHLGLAGLYLLIVSVSAWVMTRAEADLSIAASSPHQVL